MVCLLVINKKIMTVEQRYFGQSIGSLGDGIELTPQVNISAKLEVDGVTSKTIYRSPPQSAST
jgi:hypothetical protein